MVVTLIGCKSSYGQRKGGVEQGPDFLRKLELSSKLQATAADGQNLSIVDLGNIGLTEEEEQEFSKQEPFRLANSKKPLLKSKLVGAVCKKFADTVEAEAKKENNFVINLGGDHSIAIGTVIGAMRAIPNPKNLRLLWVDAHADINTPQTTLSGNIHGMPISFMTGNQLFDSPSKVPGFEWIDEVKNYINISTQLVYIGLRDVDPGEKDIIAQYDIKSFYAEDVRELGIEEVMNQTLKHFGVDGTNKELHLHLSFDVDALDPVFAPATGTAVVKGLLLEEGKYICKTCKQTGILKTMDLTEVNPTLSDENGQIRTGESAIELICSVL